MSTRRAVPAFLAIVFAVMFFGLGNYLAARQSADSEERLASLRAEVEFLRHRDMQQQAAGTTGRAPMVAVSTMDTAANRASIIADVKRELTVEMGLLPLTLLRERRNSFVELNAFDDKGRSSYGTAGYLGNGYFITVKHAVVALGQEGMADPRKIASVKLTYKGKALTAKIVDYGDALAEVDPGRLGDRQGQGTSRSAGAQPQPLVLVRLRGSDLPAGERLLEGHHPLDGLRGPAHGQQPRDLPDRRASRRLRRRRAQQRRRPRGDSHRPDAGRLSLLVHPAAASGDAAESEVAGIRADQAHVSSGFFRNASSLRLISASSPRSTGS